MRTFFVSRVLCLKEAFRAVFSSRAYKAIGGGSFLAFLALYVFTLPATYTGGTVGLISLHFLTPSLLAFSFFFSFLMAFIVPFSLYAFREGAHHRPSIAAGGVLGSIIPPLLCCSPLLPSAAALVSGVFPFAFSVSGFVRGFIATYETDIYIILVLILVVSLFVNADYVMRAKNKTCAIEKGGQEETGTEKIGNPC